MNQIVVGEFTVSSPYRGRRLVFSDGMLYIEGAGVLQAPALRSAIDRGHITWWSAEMEQWARAYSAALQEPVPSLSQGASLGEVRATRRRQHAKKPNRTPLIVGAVVLLLVLGAAVRLTLLNPTFQAMRSMTDGTTGTVVAVDPMTASTGDTRVNILVHVKTEDGVLQCENSIPDVAPGDEVAIRQKETGGWEITEVLSREGRNSPPAEPQVSEYEKARQSLAEEEEPGEAASSSADQQASALAMDARKPLRVIGDLANDVVVFGAMTNESGDWESFWSKSERAARVTEAKQAIQELQALESAAQDAGADDLADVISRGTVAGSPVIEIANSADWAPYEKFVREMRAADDQESYRWTANYVRGDWFPRSDLETARERRDELRSMWNKNALYAETELGRIIERGQ